MQWDNLRSPLELAKQLGTDAGRELSTADFLRLYERVRPSDDVETLWQLGGATNDYLRRWPNAFPAPLDLAKHLLAIDDIDARLVGLKLLTRCGVPTDQFFAEVVRALRRETDFEICGGLHELSVWLDRELRAKSKYTAEQLRPIDESLRRVSQSNAADYNVEWATRQLGYLQELL